LNFGNLGAHTTRKRRSQPLLGHEFGGRAFRG